VREVSRLTNAWIVSGLITKEEKKAIMMCAGEANIPAH